MAYYGFWYCEEMDALQAFLKVSQEHVTGQVRLRLDRGNVIVVGRDSAHSLYDAAIASMEHDGGAYDQSDATGFIRLQALPLRVAAGRQARLGKKSMSKATVAKKGLKKARRAKK